MLSENEFLYVQDIAEVFMHNGQTWKGRVLMIDDEIIVLRLKYDRDGGGYCYRDIMLYKKEITGIMSQTLYVLEDENDK